MGDWNSDLFFMLRDRGFCFFCLHCVGAVSKVAAQSTKISK